MTQSSAERLAARQKAAAAYIRRAYLKLGISPTELARLLNKSASTINRPLSNNPGSSAPKLDLLMEIQKLSGVPFTKEVNTTYNVNIIKDIQLPTLTISEQIPSDNLSGSDAQRRVVQGQASQIPVLGMAQAGSDGSFILNQSDGGLFIERPIGLAGRDRIYALRIDGNSMYPAHEDGDIVFVDPGRRPYPGRDAIIELFPENDHTVGRAFLKRVVKINNEFIVVKEFQPEEREFRISRRLIRGLHLVLRNNEMY